MNFWRGVLSIFDIFGVLHEPVELPPKDERTDMEKIRDDWLRILPPEK